MIHALNLFILLFFNFPVLFSSPISSNETCFSNFPVNTSLVTQETYVQSSTGTEENITAAEKNLTEENFPTNNKEWEDLTVVYYDAVVFILRGEDEFTVEGLGALVSSTIVVSSAHFVRYRGQGLKILAKEICETKYALKTAISEVQENYLIHTTEFKAEISVLTLKHPLPTVETNLDWIGHMKGFKFAVIDKGIKYMYKKGKEFEIFLNLRYMVAKYVEPEVQEKNFFFVGQSQVLVEIRRSVFKIEGKTTVIRDRVMIGPIFRGGRLYGVFSPGKNLNNEEFIFTEISPFYGIIENIRRQHEVSNMENASPGLKSCLKNEASKSRKSSRKVRFVRLSSKSSNEASVKNSPKKGSSKAKQVTRLASRIKKRFSESPRRASKVASRTEQAVVNIGLMHPYAPLYNEI